VSGLFDAPVQPEALPDWLHTGNASKVGQIYRLLRAAGSRGVTNAELAAWGRENYCTSVFERLRDIRKARPGSVVATQLTKGTWLYVLGEYA
jgi:hypothetical protein